MVSFWGILDPGNEAATIGHLFAASIFIVTRFATLLSHLLKLEQVKNQDISLDPENFQFNCISGFEIGNIFRKPLDEEVKYSLLVVFVFLAMRTKIYLTYCNNRYKKDFGCFGTAFADRNEKNIK